MSKPQITPQEQLQLRNTAKNEIERLEAIQNNEETMAVIDAFKNCYNICETAYKIILAEHQNRKGKTPTRYLKVCMTQVPFALDFAGYKFEKTLLSELFGGKPTLHGTTAKKLRDATTHGMDAAAVNEIVSRKDELFGYMETFLETIKTFDTVAA